jgi:Uncharacterized conserved protein
LSKLRIRLYKTGLYKLEKGLANKKNGRLLSLDAFRGMTVIGMIFVNNPGNGEKVYPALEHVKWNGCTPADMVFPFFLFIVGVSITMSLAGRKERGEPDGKLMRKIFKRSIIIFLLGIFLGGFPFVSIKETGTNWIGFYNLKLPGILPRIAIIYFISSVIFLKANVKTIGVITAAILLLYWAVMIFIPVPGVGYPNLEPGTNMVAWADNFLLSGILPKAATALGPEGMLSTFPAVASTLAGVLLGYWLRKNTDDSVKVVWIFVWGNICLIAGIIWNIGFPINKLLWTSSFVLYTTGIGLEIFGICYWLADVKGFKQWAKPFVPYGVNAFFVYFISVIFSRTIKQLIFVQGINNERQNFKEYAYQTFVSPLFSSPYNASAAWAFLIVLFWFCVLWVLYKKNIFIKI